jgi:tryptophan synthase alpha chain
MNRIDSKFAALKEAGKSAFIPYICCGDPSVEASEQLVYALEEAGADIIELGVPYSDPLADGPVIQEAGLRAYEGGYRVADTFKIISNVRKNSEVPLVVMVYYSTILGFGAEKFIKSCAESGADGLIVPDLPYEEYDEIKSIMDTTDLYLIPLIALTSGDRIPMLTKDSKGFIYCVSSMGVTGVRNEFDKRVDGFINSVKATTDTPVCIGFGISRHSDVEHFGKLADGCIVGSAIVRKIYESKMNLDEIKSFVKEMING